MNMENVRLQPAIRGKIADRLNNPLASVHVRLCGSGLAEKRSALTGSWGSFMFSPVPPGVYSLEVKYSGFSKLVQRGIAVQEHTITGIDLKLELEKNSRTLRLCALSLDYVNDLPANLADEDPGRVGRELSQVVAELSLEKALFNPPAMVTVGRTCVVELGVYQNLKETITRRLLERKVDWAGGAPIQVALTADLQATGCLVIPRSRPRVEIGGARYLEWRWEILPQVAGRRQVRLDLCAHVSFAGLDGLKKCLLTFSRKVLIRGSLFLSLKRMLKKIIAEEALPGHPER